MTRPWRSTSGPPEFPGLIAASRLDEVLEGRRGLVIPIQDPDLATLRVDDPRRGRRAKAQRVAQSDHPVAHRHRIRCAQLDHGQVLRIDLQDRHVGIRIATDDLMARGSADRYFQQEIKDALKLVPEGIEGQVPYKGPAASILHQLIGGLRASMGYTGAKDLAAFHERAELIRISTASFRESHVHDVTITRESPNYPRES